MRAMRRAMFPTYRFEHPKLEEVIDLDGLSYVWAGLFGAAYVWRAGHGSVLRALAVHSAYIILLVAAVSITSFVLALHQFLLLLIGVPAIFVGQARSMIRIVRSGLRREGWRATAT
jgi:hypothetical protein